MGPARLKPVHVIGLDRRDDCVQVFKIKPLRAWAAVATSIVSMAACLWIIAQSPWYLLPFAWALAGTAFTGVCPTYPAHTLIVTYKACIRLTLAG